MILAAIQGFVFGLSGGLTPGPLSLYAIERTINKGRRAGVLVSLVPLITDAPIIIAAILLVNSITHIEIALRIISLTGASYLVYLAYSTWHIDLAQHEVTSDQSTLMKGILINYLNPNPYLFWFTVGAPTIKKIGNDNIYAAILFLFMFYLMLCGSKIVMVFFTNKINVKLNEKYIKIITRVLSFCLLLFAIQLSYSSIIQ